MREIVIGRGVPENRVFVHRKPNREMGFKHKLNPFKKRKTRISGSTRTITR